MYKIDGEILKGTPKRNPIPVLWVWLTLIFNPNSLKMCQQLAILPPSSDLLLLSSHLFSPAPQCTWSFLPTAVFPCCLLLWDIHLRLHMQCFACPGNMSFCEVIASSQWQPSKTMSLFLMIEPFILVMQPVLFHAGTHCMLARVLECQLFNFKFTVYKHEYYCRACLLLFLLKNWHNLLFSNVVQVIAIKDVKDFHHFLGNFIWKF